MHNNGDELTSRDKDGISETRDDTLDDKGDGNNTNGSEAETEPFEDASDINGDELTSKEKDGISETRDYTFHDKGDGNGTKGSGAETEPFEDVSSNNGDGLTNKDKDGLLETHFGTIDNKASDEDLNDSSVKSITTHVIVNTQPDDFEDASDLNGDELISKDKDGISETQDDTWANKDDGNDTKGSGAETEPFEDASDINGNVLTTEGKDGISETLNDTLDDKSTGNDTRGSGAETEAFEDASSENGDGLTTKENDGLLETNYSIIDNKTSDENLYDSAIKSITTHAIVSTQPDDLDLDKEGGIKDTEGTDETKDEHDTKITSEDASTSGDINAKRCTTVPKFTRVQTMEEDEASIKVACLEIPTYTKYGGSNTLYLYESHFDFIAGQTNMSRDKVGHTCYH